MGCWVLNLNEEEEILKQILTHIVLKYACKQTLGVLVYHKENLKLDSITHSIAIKFGFKGAWDSYGKWIKDVYDKEMKSAQVNMHENAQQVFDFLAPIVEKQKPLPNLLTKTTWKMTSNSIHLVLDNYYEYCQISSRHGGSKVVFSNREVVQPKRDKIASIPNLKQHHYFYTGPRHHLDPLLFEAGENLERGKDDLFTCRICHLKVNHEKECLEKYLSDDHDVLYLQNLGCACRNCYLNMKSGDGSQQCQYTEVTGGGSRATRKKHITKKQTLADTVP